MRRCLNRWRREMLEEAPPTTTLLMLGQVHLEKWSLGGCGMYWRNDVGMLGGKKSYDGPTIQSGE